ncbi:hypothetical protein SAMN05444157_0746 [Frankineae bacterium MT45]|nr:hypothetical protein SAMN05444157_0746 [Frankineae bacterium MT45]
MTGGYRRRGGAPDLHRAWLELVDTDGPFLSVPALRAVWPQGLPQPSPDRIAALKQAKPAFEKAWDNWDRNRDGDAAGELYREERDLWVSTVLTKSLGWGLAYRALDASTGGIEPVRSPDWRLTIAATGALMHADTAVALVLVVDPVDSVRDPLTDGWASSPIDRMEMLLRHNSVPIGLVTDGRWWAIVSAAPGTMAASGVFDAQTWIDEPQTRNAFLEILARGRLVGGKPETRLPAIFADSVAAAEQITEALGVQVRRAVELLVQAMSESALDARADGENDPLPADRSQIYEAAVTVMMRVVFLLFAEERGLVPQSHLFAAGYGISGEFDALDSRRRDEVAEALDATTMTWHRLLATSQALYRGASFEDLRLPSYGGSLFNPARFPFLTARTERGTLAVTVSDRVMVEVLHAVQFAQLRGEPARRISFRDIDVEQIGYIYEGLLGYSTAEVGEVTLGLIGKDGEEPEITLAELEALAAANPEPAKLAARITATVKASQPACKPPTLSALTKAIASADTVEDAERALRAVTGDADLRERLKPFVAIIRRDLRDRPFVVRPGGVVVVETPSRASSGAHYTPKSLAEEVVLHALEPLVYSPGPHELADREKWQPLPSERILQLKVADIACGSGAFLVAAARYLADRLVEAWQREQVATADPHELRISAVRKVVANCLYGADINGMAVEMCKLSLWLVSLDPKLPFSFVDDKVLHGNSLLGLTDARQLEALHIDPDRAGPDKLFETGDATSVVKHLDVGGVLAQAAALRRSLASEVDDADPQRSATTKRRQWQDYQRLTATLATVADGVIAAGLRLGGKPGKALDEAYENLRIAVGSAYPEHGQVADGSMLDAIIAAGLTPTVPTDYARWKPLHWILAVPDVMEYGGFDAIIGNPPFLGGQKLTGTQGTNLRDWLVNEVASGQRGSADLVAYFFLRSFALLNASGNLGLIATNTIAQGDTRAVGLDTVVSAGLAITRAIRSRSWPSASANLEYAAVWGAKSYVGDDVPRSSDEVACGAISTLLEPAGTVTGNPVRLTENADIAFQGCIVLGMGFVVEPELARQWIADDPKNAEVLAPYLNGEDLNSRPDASPSRWVIDFYDRSQDEAAKFVLPFQRIAALVRPERQKVNRKALRERWWQYAEKRPGMRKAIAGMDDVLVIALVSKTVMPVRVPMGQVFSHKLAVFATNSFADQGVLSSSVHQLWAVRNGSTMRADVNYSPSDAFVTFPRPVNAPALHASGKILDVERQEIMLRRQLGLTKLYNLVNDPDIAASTDADVARMREIHVELDRAVMAAFGWDDVPLDHGFHTYRQMTRWTVSPAARVEIFDRLLAENHRRAALQGDLPPAAERDQTEDDSGDDDA